MKKLNKVFNSNLKSIVVTTLTVIVLGSAISSLFLWAIFNALGDEKLSDKSMAKVYHNYYSRLAFTKQTTVEVKK